MADKIVSVHTLVDREKTGVKDGKDIWEKRKIPPNTDVTKKFKGDELEGLLAAGAVKRVSDDIEKPEEGDGKK